MAAWRPRRSVRIQELEDGLFLAMFEHMVDMRRVLDEGPWLVERDLVILKPLDEDEQPSNMDMSKSPFWIRLLNLPFSRRSENYVRAIAGRLGTVLEVDTHRLKEGSKHIRVRVMIDVSKPLCRHLSVINRKHEKVMVGLCYERLPNFCYWCGHLGHTEKECLDKPANIDGKVFENWPFQESLRAPPIREGISRSDTLSVQPGVHVVPSFDVRCSHVLSDHSTTRAGTDGLKEDVIIKEKEINVNGKTESMLQNIEINHENSGGGDENNEYNATGGQSNGHMVEQQKIDIGSPNKTQDVEIISHNDQVSDPLHCNKSRTEVEKEDGRSSGCSKETGTLDISFEGELNHEVSRVQSLQTTPGCVTKEGDALRRNSWKRQTRVLPISGLPAASDRPNEKQGNKREWTEFAGSDYMEVDCETRSKNGRSINETARAAGQPRRQP
ncbi:reverse transcriptase [Tanacetum coccineum]|uniref:Reverse transcriptase n=1 Tax=Tanacetum coccineum TaxID=301880 RepID=A0ABQ5JEJ7_9ASTR